MDSKELSQTGRQLLNKGKKSFIRAVFNRKTLLFVSLLLQAGILFEGKLEDSDSFDISFTSCDCTITALPFTGQPGFLYIPAILLMLCMGFFIAYKPKKEKPE